jgi:hypothetical protein
MSRPPQHHAITATDGQQIMTNACDNRPLKDPKLYSQVNYQLKID